MTLDREGCGLPTPRKNAAGWCFGVARRAFWRPEGETVQKVKDLLTSFNLSRFFGSNKTCA